MKYCSSLNLPPCNACEYENKSFWCPIAILHRYLLHNGNDIKNFILIYLRCFDKDIVSYYYLSEYIKAYHNEYYDYMNKLLILK